MLQADHATGESFESQSAGFDTDSLERRIQGLCRGWSLEVTPRTAIHLAKADPPVATGSQVYITHLPGQPFEDVIATAAWLRSRGYDPVPHLVARSVPNHGMLVDWLERLTQEAKVDAVLLIAGSMATHLGPYPDTLTLLEEVSLAEHGIRRLAVAGHPEGHPHADDEALDQALATKLTHAERDGLEMWLVTQFLFNAEPLLDWHQRLTRQGFELPIRVGLPGPASLATLWKYAMSCGIGASVTTLQRQGSRMLQLARPKPPSSQVLGLARHATPRLALHFYPFGGIDKTLAWCQALEAGRFRLDAQQREIIVDG
ncbi:methylenetetrahydrofolate reductase [Litchfieldella qijiaojingensis]|uniref:Methylenetetrahydrofolate reductase n=1 Tax=Litchfieldella qijiaojingensis TaxID=980347 RepID=A0ABQ2YAR1_9GAMM|nr:hypothetical protein [Halomonas qijiaojingensis]GGX77249.1 methylenetetrahydrofolate reductase [Halomonas qijiaojingensis]